MATLSKLLLLVDALYKNAETRDKKITYMNLALESLSTDFGLEVEDSTTLTVADTDEYSYPTGITDAYEIISLAVANNTIPTSRYDYRKYNLSKREDNPQSEYCFYQIVSDSGAKKFVLYPVPETSGHKILIRYHKKLTLFTESDLNAISELDDRFHEMLAFYCCHMIAASGSSPDTTQANMFMQKYDSCLTALWTLQNKKDTKKDSKRRSNPQWSRSHSHSSGFTDV
jgi:hypothetical protein